MKIPLSDNGYLDIRLSYIDYATDQTRIDSVGQWGWQGNQYIYIILDLELDHMNTHKNIFLFPILYEHRYNVYDKIDLYSFRFFIFLFL